VHQIELEIQNEELRNAREDAEASRARYFDLYNLAGGLLHSLERESILGANFTAATRLRIAWSELVERPPCSFVFKEDQGATTSTTTASISAKSLRRA
jgi:hypothetical protein